jgi:SnoaL-like domain
MTPGEVVGYYIAAWNAEQESERAILLELCWASDGIYTDPRSAVRGREQLSAHIERLHKTMPGVTFELASGLDTHHRFVRFVWRMTNSGTPPLDGMDIGELAAVGRLQSIVGFFSTLPV